MAKITKNLIECFAISDFEKWLMEVKNYDVDRGELIDMATEAAGLVEEYLAQTWKTYWKTDVSYQNMGYFDMDKSVDHDDFVVYWCVTATFDDVLLNNDIFTFKYNFKNMIPGNVTVSRLPLFENFGISEALVKIKRKWTDKYPAVHINPAAIMRNKIVLYIGDNGNKIAAPDMSAFLDSLEGDVEIGKKPHNGWLYRNTKIIKSYVSNGVKCYTLTKLGERIYNHLKAEPIGDKNKDFKRDYSLSNPDDSNANMVMRGLRKTDEGGKDEILLKLAKTAIDGAKLSVDEIKKVLKKNDKSYIRGYFASRGIDLTSQQAIISQIDHINESYDEFTLQDLEDHIEANWKDILGNMETYGVKLKNVGKIRNYYDLAHILDVDTRSLKDVDLRLYAETTQELMKDNIDESKADESKIADDTRDVVRRIKAIEESDLYQVTKSESKIMIYWKIYLIGSNNHLGIGYDKVNGYWFCNRHSGSIDNPSKSLNGVWNYSEGHFKDKPHGYYTLSEREIMYELNF